jgi:D-tagatose-1,6-bisphosphate aldolase subunit GatZ/KbaZ
MERGVETVRQYVRAGASKIHLDASMALAGDPPGPLAESVVAARAAELACAAEEEAAQVSSAPAYVVGTEVPPPGGHAGPDAGPTVTRAEDAERTLELVGEAFSSRGLGGALARVVALVVQPGVEFGDDVVFAYRRETAAPLARLAEARGIVFEAHSTDYQHDDALRALVADRFAILKVGPALTFAYREALFGLESIERELLAGRGEPLSGLRQALDDAMRADPRHWVGFCSGDEEAGRLQRAYGLSDRCRYYWCRPGVEEARRRLFAHLEGRRIPRGLASQFLPDALDTDGGPERLVAARVRRAFRPWARACRAGPGVAESGECP